MPDEPGSMGKIHDLHQHRPSDDFHDKSPTAACVGWNSGQYCRPWLGLKGCCIDAKILRAEPLLDFKGYLVEKTALFGQTR